MELYMPLLVSLLVVVLTMLLVADVNTPLGK
jgi:hypothetical protein